MGGQAVIQGHKTTETNTFQNQRKEVSNMAVLSLIHISPSRAATAAAKASRSNRSRVFCRL